MSHVRVCLVVLLRRTTNIQACDEQQREITPGKRTRGECAERQRLTHCMLCSW